MQKCQIRDFKNKLRENKNLLQAFSMSVAYFKKSVTVLRDLYVKINYKSWHFTMKCYSTSCVLDIWNRAEEIMGIEDTIGIRYEVFQNPVSPFDTIEELDIADENRITIDVCDDEDLW